MANNWTIESSKPAKGAKYEWRLPANQQQHVEETTAPGDLAIKPKDVELKPTNAPKKSGVQSGLSDWTLESGVVSDWYVFGEIVQE